nr:S8 family peptidase [Pedobacter glucosidilyticus]
MRIIKRQVMKTIGLLALLVIPAFLQAQKTEKTDWYNKDLQKDGSFGISADKAYQEILKGKKSTPVIVAVLDGGVDTTHEDLKSVLWQNRLEIAGNGIDDDKNGYVDDVYGWNFMGSAKGNVEFDNIELVRVLLRDMEKFDGKDSNSVRKAELPALRAYQKNLRIYDQKKRKAEQEYFMLYSVKKTVDSLIASTGKEKPNLDEFKASSPASKQQEQIKKLILVNMKANKNDDFQDFYEQELARGVKYYYEQLYYHLNMAYNSRPLVGDNYQNSYEKSYGNLDVMGPDAEHGSHVAGIIAADRTNNKGIRGVADNVSILAVRTVPNGDERDKDVANSIIYAVDNGAKVINMSFGKSHSWDKEAVDKAVQYAMKKDVLLVHAAGNDNKNLDLERVYPNRYFNNGKTAQAWIEVGASDAKNDKTLKASFSNYGKTTVDVFAPGVDINSTIPGSLYKANSGTSMAAPVVSGLAALIRSYYPSLSAVQVKEIIMKSVVKVNQDVEFMVDGKKVKVPFTDLSIAGGIVNAYEALKLAETYK